MSAHRTCSQVGSRGGDWRSLGPGTLVTIASATTESQSILLKSFPKSHAPAHVPCVLWGSVHTVAWQCGSPAVLPQPHSLHVPAWPSSALHPRLAEASLPPRQVLLGSLPSGRPCSWSLRSERVMPAGGSGRGCVCVCPSGALPRALLRRVCGSQPGSPPAHQLHTCSAACPEVPGVLSAG